MKIVILDGFPVNPGDQSWDAIASLGDLVIYDRTMPDQIADRCSDAEIVLTNKVVLGKDNIERLPNLRYIGVLATGYNIVDIKSAAERGIVVTNIPAYSTDSVAQQTIALLLTITNHTEYYSRHNREGRWCDSTDFSYSDHRLIELAGKQFGIIGFGNIGQATSRVASALGMRIAAYSSKSAEELGDVTKMDLDTLLATSDVVSLHCPLTPETHHIINSKRLSLMKKTAILLNTGRGPLIDEPALADALNNDRLYAAGLDVLSQEPPSKNNPLLSARNCYITPHLAWASFEARKRLIEIAAFNIKHWLEGNPANVVNAI